MRVREHVGENARVQAGVQEVTRGTGNQKKTDRKRAWVEEREREREREREMERERKKKGGKGEQG